MLLLAVGDAGDVGVVAIVTAVVGVVVANVSVVLGCDLSLLPLCLMDGCCRC